MRTCPKCNTEKEDTEFYKNKKDANGKQTVCKECQKVYAKDLYHSRVENEPDFRAKRNKYQCDYLRKKRRAAGIPERGIRGAYTGVICNMIKKHHEEQKDDPEHLTTEFMQKILGRRCKK